MCNVLNNAFLNNKQLSKYSFCISFWWRFLNSTISQPLIIILSFAVLWDAGIDWMSAVKALGRYLISFQFFSFNNAFCFCSFPGWGQNIESSTAALSSHAVLMCWLQSILSLQYRWWKVPEPPSVRLSEVSPSRPLNGAAAPWGGGGRRDKGILGREWTPPYRLHRRHHFDQQLAQPCVPCLHVSGPLHCSKTHTHRRNTIPGSTRLRALFG